MSPSRKSTLFSLLIILIGIGWLLNTIHVIPNIDWVWTGALALVGVLVLFSTALNRFTYIIGFFMLLASAMSVLRQTGKVTANIEVPLLVVGFGLLTLTAEMLRLPMPNWMAEATLPPREGVTVHQADGTTTRQH